MKNIGVISLGCAKNRVDTEMMLGDLTHQGFAVTNKTEEADVLIVNTCGFIGPAKEESIDTILEMAEYKKIGTCEKLIIMGCLSQRYGENLITDIPEIDFVVGSGDFVSVSKILTSEDTTQKKNHVTTPSFIDSASVKRVLTTPGGSAYVKIAEGCSSKCSFCIIPQLRGAYTSRPIDSIIQEIEYLTNEGIKEIIIIAQDTTAYGHDLAITDGLSVLLKEIAAIDHVEWIRILYSHSSSITKNFIAVLQEEKKICSYLDIPVQHSHNAILTAMRRPETESTIKNTIFTLRSTIPDISLRTSCIVGFPGESEKRFNHLHNFIEEMKFDHLGVFQFSQEEGTAAAKLSDDVSSSVKEERVQTIMETQRTISLEKNKKKIGQIYPVLVEGKTENEQYLFTGRTSQQAPEIDGIVYIESGGLQVGDIVPIQITGALEYDLIGKKVAKLN